MERNQNPSEFKICSVPIMEILRSLEFLEDKTISEENIEPKVVIKRSSKKIICQECSEECFSKYGLARHKREVHPDKVKCDFCDKITRKHHLKNHILKKHSEEMYECDVCGCKSIYSNKKLIPYEHRFREKKMRTCYGCYSCKIFHCDTCKKSFRYKAELRRHIQAKHLK